MELMVMNNIIIFWNGNKHLEKQTFHFVPPKIPVVHPTVVQPIFISWETYRKKGFKT